MIGTLLGLAGLWSRLGSLLSAALTAVEGFVRRNPWQALVVALVLACGTLVWRGNRLADDVKARDATIASIKAAQKVATDNQIHVNQLPAIDTAAIARKSDANAPAYYAAVDAAADAHRVVVRPSSGPSSPASVRPTDQAEQSVHGADATPGLVCRPAADDGLILKAAERAAQMRADAQGWIADGIAVPDVQD